MERDKQCTYIQIIIKFDRITCIPFSTGSSVYPEFPKNNKGSLFTNVYKVYRPKGPNRSGKLMAICKSRE
jgi:hypothetical protein